MENILYHEDTISQIDSFVSKPSHALLIYGPRGSGKTATMATIAAKTLGIEPSKLDSYPYLLRLVPDEKQKISVDTVRNNVDHFLSSKVPGNNAIRRILEIEEADKMTEEAQNALLKNLEEPPLDTLFILTSSNLNKLLLTVRSRTTILRIKRPTAQDLSTQLQQLGFDKTSIERAMGLSGGMPGLALAILKNENTSLVQAAQKAREVLSASQYERLVLANELSKNSQLFSDMLQVIQLMSATALEKADVKQTIRWKTVLAAAHEAQEMLSDKANAKLNTTRFLLALGQ